MALLALLAALTATGAVAPRASDLRVVILHTNDLHGRVRREAGAPGIAALAAHIKKVRADAKAAGAQVIVVDGGDFFQGTPEGDLTAGRLVIECMNEIGYDALCVGNHDLHLGPKALAQLRSLARFPFLAANVHRKGKCDPPAWARDSVTLGAVQIAGFTTPEAPQIARESLDFDDEPRVRWQAGAVHILATHVGLERDRALAGKQPVTAILGAHSHDLAAEKVGKVWILQSLCHGVHVGRLDLVLRDGAVISESATNEKVDPKGADPAVKAIVERAAREIDRSMDQVVGNLAQPLLAGSRDRIESSALGNFLTDLMRASTGADIALHNRTGIRASLGKGRVRLRDIYEAAPFDDTVVAMTLAGSDVRNLIENALSEGAKLLEVSGLEVEWDPGAAPGKRVVSLAVGGRPLEPGKRYRVATNSLLAKGGDGFTAFRRGRDRMDTQAALLDLLRIALGKQRPLKYAAPNRIRAIR